MGAAMMAMHRQRMADEAAKKREERFTGIEKRLDELKVLYEKAYSQPKAATTTTTTTTPQPTKPQKTTGAVPTPTPKSYSQKMAVKINKNSATNLG